MKGPKPRTIVFTDEPNEVSSFLAGKIAEIYQTKGDIKTAKVHTWDCTDFDFLARKDYVAQVGYFLGKAANAAKDGVLLIQNAHVLQPDFIDEARHSLIMMAARANREKDLVIILAGEKQLLQDLLDSSDSLKKAYSTRYDAVDPDVYSKITGNPYPQGGDPLPLLKQGKVVSRLNNIILCN